MKKALLIISCLILSITAFADDYWIYFTDKGLDSKDGAKEKAREYLTKKALEKREALGKEPGIIDLPVYESYIDSLENLGLDYLGRSKWLNAACFEVESLRDIEDIRFIEKTRKSRTYYRQIDTLTDQLRYQDESLQRTGDINYGITYTQLKQLGIIDMHEYGYFGEGIRIGVFDTGFNIFHPAFDSLNLIAQYDFINDTAYVGNLPDDPLSQDDHGTKVLGIIAGIIPDDYRGGAHKAEFLLAKTEDMQSETIQEEYNWVEAVEWAYDNDVDIITSSLGYSDWYTFDALDGDSAITTNIADIAASLGILVINSAGNSRTGFGHITPPADGDSVLTVGALGPEGSYASFSSPGPTFDGRIKPDVTTLGEMVWLLSPNDDTGENFVPGNGTSYSCPLVTAATALVMQARDDLGDAVFGWDLGLLMKNTADMHCTPDNDYGWGRPIAPVAAGLEYDGYNYKAISIALLDSLGQRIEGTVTLQGADTVIIKNTEKRGVFTFYPILPDEYIVEIEGDDYPVFVDTFFIEEDDLTHCRNIDMSSPSTSPEPNGECHFSIYPVPAKDRLTVSRHEIDKKQKLALQLFDAGGNPCFNGEKTLNAYQKAHTFILENPSGEALADGIYFAFIYLSENDEKVIEEKSTIIISNKQ
ncbi:MAG: S8 family serine peptidase [Candidatus Zixiibacteriota bacterium]